MTTPAAASSLRVTKATPGVVITPADRHSAPALLAPSISACSIEGPDSRVSLPMMILGRAPDAARCEANEKPIAVTVAGSSGNCPASPRIPSVPKRAFISVICVIGGLLQRYKLRSLHRFQRYLSF